MEICWSLAPPDLVFERSVSFLANALPSSATADDYSSFPQSVVPSDANDVCVSFEANEDDVIEDKEMFAVVLVTDSALQFNDSLPNTAQVSV